MATVAHQNSIQDSGQTLRSQLAQVSKRVRVVGTVDSLLWALAATGIALLLLAWMDIIWHLPTGVRQAILPLAVLVGGGAFAILAYRVWKLSTADRVARRLDEAGHTGGQILSGWELLPEHAQTDNEPQATAALARGIASVAVDQASQRASTVALADAAPWSESRRSGVTAAVVAVVTLVFALLAPGAFGTSWNRFVSPTIDTPPYSPLVFEVTPGDVELTYGQPLEVTAEVSGGAIENASLVLGDPADPNAKRVAMFPRGGGRWQAVVPRVIESTTYCVTAQRGRSRLFELNVLETPTIEAASYTLIAPAYTGLPPRQGRYPQDPIAGLSGTEVELQITSNRPLHSGTVTIKADESVSDATPQSISLGVSPEDPQRVQGIVTIQRSGNWSISVTGDNGVPCLSPIEMEVELLVDRPPIVRIVQPRRKSYATPTTRIPVTAVGEDDFGIARMRLYRIIDGS
ncbi:MAG: hypothetical protein MI861_16905, partial [Pirellulales bacterium]|nr:hypothetical protein [Pirellulales bacterium]